MCFREPSGSWACVQSIRVTGTDKTYESENLVGAISGRKGCVVLVEKGCPVASAGVNIKMPGYSLKYLGNILVEETSRSLAP